jgi:predicted AlkP superfamily phosphohydrolase/phosphomutase
MDNSFDEFIDQYAQIVSDTYNQVSTEDHPVSQAYHNDEYNYIITKIHPTAFALTRAIKPYNDLLHWDITAACNDDSIFFEHLLIKSEDDEEPDQIIDVRFMAITDSFTSIQERKACIFEVEC